MLRNDGLKYNLSPPTLVRCVSICLEKDEMLLNMQPLIMMIKREWILIKCIFHLDFKGVIYDTKTEVIIHKDNLLAPINCNSSIPQVINLVPWFLTHYHFCAICYFHISSLSSRK